MKRAAIVTGKLCCTWTNGHHGISGMELCSCIVIESTGRGSVRVLTWQGSRWHNKAYVYDIKEMNT